MQAKLRPGKVMCPVVGTLFLKILAWLSSSYYSYLWLKKHKHIVRNDESYTIDDTMPIDEFAAH